MSARSVSVLFLSALTLAWQAPPTRLVTRGPYLQSLSATGATLVCRTDADVPLTLFLGERPGPPWSFERRLPAGETHVFELSGLRPETRYAYALSAEGLVGRTSGSFRTHPPARSQAPFRFAAWGDSGTETTPQFEVAARVSEVVPPPAFVLLLGDIVYEDGAWEDYDRKLFRPYAELFRSVPPWPTLGNHDVRTEEGAPYFDAFYLPTTSGAPGHPSLTERYYSFDHGPAHFVCLDSALSSSAPGGAMAVWLADDLGAARARGSVWQIVYMHHPVYSRGSHDSTEEPDLIALHDDLVPLFDAQGVDLVLSGHSHCYERSYLVTGDAILQGDASEYTKFGTSAGTLYVVSGCGGENGSGPLDHPLMARSYGRVNGFSLFDVSASELCGRFVEDDGRTTDLFTLRKASDATPPRVADAFARDPNELTLVFDEPVRAGADAGGAEDPLRYRLEPEAVVVGAELGSDASTVRLATSPLDANRAYSLTVQGVADPAGNLSAPRTLLVRARDTGLATEVALAPGGAWRSLAGRVPPPVDWTARAFDDSTWTAASMPIGYGYPDLSTRLTDMRGQYGTLYLRGTFELPDPAAVAGLRLRLRYDDGFVAYLNGAEFARANVPIDQANGTPALASHAAGELEDFDAGDFAPLLVAGTNVLALEGRNVALDGEDFLLEAELVLARPGSGGPPRSTLGAQVRTANAPARVRFSSAGSADGDGPLAGLRWDFGDGTSLSVSSPGSAVEVEHEYTAPGTYTASLIARDGDGHEALARETIRVHDLGSAPSAALAVDALVAAPGAPVAFDAAGSSDGDGGALFVTWDFGDPASGSANVSAELAPTHVYHARGTYVATLVVTDDEGSSAEARVTLTVASAPSARFSATPAPGEPLRLRFRDESEGEVDAWTWDFGDGATSDEAEPEHLYALPGEYLVRLAVRGPAGEDEVERTLRVGLGGGSSGGGCSIAFDGEPPRADAVLLALTLFVLAAWLRALMRLRSAAESS